MILALAHPVPAASNSHRHPRLLRPASARGRDQHGLRTQVVYLTENMRHAQHPTWVTVLDAFRRGLYAEEHVAYINGTCAIATQPEPGEGGFCPYITSSNAVRHQVNRASTYQYARRHGLPIFAVPACAAGRPVQRDLLTMPPELSDRVPMLLELVVGMPVSCSRNLPSLALANGTLGTLLALQWDPRTTFTTTVSQDGVTTHTASGQPEYIFFQPFITAAGRLPLPGLPEGSVPLPPHKGQVHFKSRGFRKTLSQVPLVPAFAITTDKTQGLTVSQCVVGPQRDEHRSKPPAQVLYVALSRVRDPGRMRLSHAMTRATLAAYKPSSVLLATDASLQARHHEEF